MIPLSKALCTQESVVKAMATIMTVPKMAPTGFMIPWQSSFMSDGFRVGRRNTMHRKHF